MNPDPRLNRLTALRALAMVFGLALAGSGLAVLLIGLNRFPGLATAAPGAQNALAVFAGLVFLLAGIAMVCLHWSKKLSAGFALAAILTFIVAFNWVAFGSGERNFSRSVSVGTQSGSSVNRSQVSNTEGRLVFGIAALAMDSLLVAGLYRVLRTRRSLRSVTRKNATQTGDV